MKDIRKVIGLLLCMTICCYMTGKEKSEYSIYRKQHNARRFVGKSET